MKSCSQYCISPLTHLLWLDPENYSVASIAQAWWAKNLGQYQAINEIGRARQAMVMIALSFGTCSEIDPSINLVSSNYEH